MLRKINKNTIANQVIDQLTDLIRSGSLKPGERLPSEREMAEQLGVSRPPLRESLRALEYAGIIETRYGDGIYVTRSDFPEEPGFFTLLNQYTLEEMVEMRKIVEKAAVRLAIERATDEDRKKLEAIQERTKKSVDDMEAFIECDFAFHSAIVEATRNSMLFKTVRTMRKLMGEFNRELLQSRDFRIGVAMQHETILNAIFAGDKNRAEEAMDKHLDNVVNLASGRKRGATKQDNVQKLPISKQRKSG